MPKRTAQWESSTVRVALEFAAAFSVGSASTPLVGNSTSEVESQFGILTTFDQIENPEKRLDAGVFSRSNPAEISGIR
jgi:hypothetical protein